MLISMSIREVEVDIREGKKFPVRLVRKPLEERDLDNLLIKNPRLDYLFMDTVIQNNKLIVVFGDARNHEEFKQAISRDIGGRIRWGEAGQLHLDKNTKKISSLRFSYLFRDDVKSKKYTNSVFDAIHSDLLSLPAVLVRYGDKSESCYEVASKKIWPLL